MSVAETIIYESSSFGGLLRLAKNKEPSHAYLLTGSSSATLVSVARAFGKWLHCENSTDVPCGTCRDCLLWESGTHPALSIVRATGKDISIDSIRDIVEKTAYKTTGNKHRIFIVDEISSITEEGANAFLKTLEEPPERTLFILLTSKPTAVMGTIYSRCISVKISLPSPQKIISNFLSATSWHKGYCYVALLLSDTSLSLIDSMSVPTSPGKESKNSPLIENKNGLDPSMIKNLTDRLFNSEESSNSSPFLSSELFTSEPSYLLNLFDQVTRWLSNYNGNENQFFSSVSTALSVDSANRALEELVEKWFKDEEKMFKEIFGKKSRDLNLATIVRKRHKRRLVSEHIFLFSKCIEIATRLGIELESSPEEDPYELETLFPQLAYFKNLTIIERESIRQVIKECRQRIKANVTEKAMLIDLCLKLTGRIIPDLME